MPRSPQIMRCSRTELPRAPGGAAGNLHTCRRRSETREPRKVVVSLPRFALCPTLGVPAQVLRGIFRGPKIEKARKVSAAPLRCASHYDLTELAACSTRCMFCLNIA